MSSQIFKITVPNELVVKLFNIIAVKTDKYYIIDYNSYKKGIYTNDIPNFIQECSPYYFLSKRKKYLERPLTYNSFTTIIRQICKHNLIKYTSQVKYDKSEYNIVYYIYF